MKAGILLRIGIYVIGVYSLQIGLSWAVYFTYAALSDTSWAAALIETSQASIYGSAVLPLVFALGCFGFASSFERLLLGPASETLVILESASALVLVQIALRLLGVYLLCTYAGHFLATFLEMIAVRSGNTTFRAEQVMSDFIANGVALALAAWLLFRTDAVVNRFFAQIRPQ